MQEGMLLHTLLSPGSGVYLEQLAFEIEGAATPGGWREAFEGIVDRHAVLRSRFEWQGLARPVQVVERAAPLPWTEEDWSGLSREEQEGRFAELLERERRQGLDLRRAPLMGVRLICLGADRWRLVWTFHHILLDGWSVAQLLREVLEAWRSGDRGRAGESRPYREFIAWLLDQDIRGAEAYWRHELRGVGRTPLLVSGPPRATPGDVSVRLRGLSVETTKALKGMGRRFGLTLNTLVQGAWALLLSRYGGGRTSCLA
jgi:hypothetical protein